MDRKSKVLFALIILLTLASIGFTYYKTVILGSFETINERPTEDLE